MPKALSTLLTLALLAPLPAAAQSTIFVDMDSDGDGRITAAEFDPFGVSEYGRWDVNTDRRLDRDEFSEGIFGAWDSDRDEMLSETEYGGGYDVWSGWFGNEGPDSYRQLDGDLDGTLSRDELRTAGIHEGAFDAWDTGRDGYLDEAEYSRGLFETYDRDRNGFIEAAELR